MITKANPGLEQRLAEAALSVLGTQVGETALAAEGAGIPRRAPLDWTAAGDFGAAKGQGEPKTVL